MLEAVLNCPDHLLHLPIGFAVVKNDVVVDNSLPLI